MEKTNKIAVIGDLTALYCTRTVHRKKINYEQLDLGLKKTFDVKTLRAANWYTLFSQENKSQVDFVKMLETKCNWNVITKKPSEIRRSSDKNANPHMDYRFDAQIAYNLGEATADDEYDQIVVISDSLELLKPLKSATNYLDVKVCFFNEVMDRRWWKAIDESDIEFIDLADVLYAGRSEFKESEPENQLSFAPAE